MKKNNAAATAPLPKLATKKQFAELNGWSPSYVTKLTKQQRLVMQGKLVDVAESMTLIEQTSGGRHDVGMRHEENRAKKQNPASSVSGKAVAVSGKRATPRNTARQTPDAELEETTLIDKEAVQDAHRRKVLADMRRAESLAEKEHLELQKLARRLLEVEQVDLSLRIAGTTIRSLMDVFPAQVAPLVAPATSIEECNNILAEQCRNVLLEFSETLQREREKHERPAA